MNSALTLLSLRSKLWKRTASPLSHSKPLLMLYDIHRSLESPSDPSSSLKNSELVSPPTTSPLSPEESQEPIPLFPQSRTCMSPLSPPVASPADVRSIGQTSTSTIPSRRGLRAEYSHDLARSHSLRTFIHSDRCHGDANEVIQGAIGLFTAVWMKTYKLADVTDASWGLEHPGQSSSTDTEEKATVVKDSSE